MSTCNIYRKVNKNMYKDDKGRIFVYNSNKLLLRICVIQVLTTYAFSINPILSVVSIVESNKCSHALAEITIDGEYTIAIIPYNGDS